MGRSSHSAPGGPAKRWTELVASPREQSRREEPSPLGGDLRTLGGDSGSLGEDLGSLGGERRSFGRETGPAGRTSPSGRETSPSGRQPRPSGKRVRTRSMTMPDKRTALIAAGAAALILALLVAWLLQGNFGYRGVNVQPQANAQPAEPGRQPNPGAGTPGRPGTPAKPGQNVGAPASGPVSAQDKDLLIKLREADLWELRAGGLATNQAASDGVTRAGFHLVDGQTRLDAQVREAAQAVQVGIPDQATADQRGWIRTLENSKGEAFDRFFVNQMRGSYGVLFILIAQVRSTTQNSVIRDLAIDATATITDHMRVLEDTGLVDPQTLRNVATQIRP